MQCRAIPYEGNDPFIFFSYSHKDADRVYPILEQMVRDGYRVWYDDGNHAGDDWLENIGQHLNRCAVCLAMLSENSEQSHNCKKEVSFAVQCNKKLLAIKLEKFAMTVGMRLQLSTIHYLEKTEYPSNAALLNKLYESDCLRECRAEPGSIPMRAISQVQQPEMPALEDESVIEAFVSSEIGAPETVAAEETPVVIPVQEEKTPVAVPVSVESPVAETTPEVKKNQIKKAKLKVRQVTRVATKISEQPVAQKMEPIAESVPAIDVAPVAEVVPVAEPVPVAEVVPVAEPVLVVEEAPAQQPVEQSVPVAEEKPANIQINEQKQETVNTPVKVPESDKKTVYIPHNVTAQENSDAVTVCADENEDAMLVRLNTQEVYVITSALTRLGRSAKRCDFEIKGNPAVSNHHADLIYYNNTYYIKDAGSSNGTFINGTKMEAEQKAELPSMSIFSISNEPMMLVFGADAANVRATSKLACLINTATNCAKSIGAAGLYLDRAHKWEDGTCGNGKVSREHAVIRYENGNFLLEDLGSTNGTYLNNERIAANQKIQLQDKAQIRLADAVLEFRIITI